MLLLNKCIVFLIFFLGHFSVATANPHKAAFDYINLYKEIAIAEMSRTGIPASIKLAQGILESNMGRSALATKANNHFGIKCGSSWTGGTYYLKDDDRNHKGKLIASCFRTFASVEESYVAHSEFLLGSPSGRYDFLFEYDPKDYKSWARGLRKAGYATDKRYPKKLITVIEKYGLDKYDQYQPIEYVYEDVDNSMPIDNTEASKPKASRLLKKKSRFTPDLVFNNYPIKSVNKLNYIEAFGGETLSLLAARIGYSTEKLMEYNEALGHEELLLDSGDIIYLQKKKRSYSGETEYHIIQEGEDMYRISQLYGLKLTNLYAKNRMPRGSEPFTGEKIYLRQVAPRGNRPKYLRKEKLQVEEPELLFANESDLR